MESDTVKNYTISFNCKNRLDDPDTTDTITQQLLLDQEELAGLLLGLGGITYKCNKLNQHLKVVSETGTIDIANIYKTEPFKSYLLGYTIDIVHFIEKFYDNSYSATLNNTQWISYLPPYEKITYDKITKTYSAIVRIPRGSIYAELYQFDSPNFIKGVKTACEWRKVDASVAIMDIFEGEKSISL